jgi:hypothetical protein
MPARRVAAAAALLLALASLPAARAAENRLSDLYARFDPPWDDTTVYFQVTARSWWEPLNEMVTVPKGRKLPVLSEACQAAPETCHQWEIPSDVKIAFRTPGGAAGAHRLCEWLLLSCLAKFLPAPALPRRLDLAAPKPQSDDIFYFYLFFCRARRPPQ